MALSRCKLADMLEDSFDDCFGGGYDEEAAKEMFLLRHPASDCTTEGASQTELGDEQADDARVGAKINVER